MEGKPRNWMKSFHQRKTRLARHGEEASERDVAFAYNDEQGGVCLIVLLGESPFVLSVFTRAGVRERERRYRAVKAIPFVIKQKTAQRRQFRQTRQARRRAS